MARDNFLKTVIEKLRMRVSNRCSNPNCRVPTTAPSGDTDKVNNIGIAAHICAASLGGPRFSSKMSTEERKSINNAIWLCANCSIGIDRDIEKYTVSILKGWKKEAESLAADELGKKLPEKHDAINTVTAALTGLPKSFLATAISNVHKATAQSLENLDPRFCVKSSHSENQTNFGIYAKENVNVLMNIQSDYSKEYMDKYQRLIEHGEDLEIYAGAIKFDGSKLLEEVSNISGNGKMVITSSKKKGIQKLWLVNKDTSVVENFEDIRGEVSFGNKSLQFEGSACDDIFTFKYRKELSKDNAKITFGLSFHKWDEIDIRFLPYFSKIFSLFEKLSNGWELYTALEIDGIRILDSKGINTSKMEFVTETISVLAYISNVSKVSEYLGVLVRFTHDYSYNYDDYKNLFDIVKTIEGKSIYSEKEITSNTSCDLVADEGAKNIDIIVNMSEPTSANINEVNAETIKCFGVYLKLPKKSVSLTNVIPSVSISGKKIKQGDIVRVEFIPSTGFECKIEYINP